MTQARIWHQARPSDHLAAERSWRYSPIQPMHPEPRPFWRRLFRRK